jgi:hypothetical protein
MDRSGESGPSYLKRLEPRDWLGFGLGNSVDSRRSRPFFQPAAQSRQFFAAAYGENLNAAIGIIAHPARNLQDVCFALDEPAKADPLYTPADNKAAGLDWIWFGRHF